MSRSLAIIGRFPPPSDGQAIATRRLASLLDTDYDIRTIDLSIGQRDLAEVHVRFRLKRVFHYLTQAPSIHNNLTSLPRQTPILWTSISPSTLGHLRDLLTVYPGLPADCPVIAVVHWGNFDRLFRRSWMRRTGEMIVKGCNRVAFLNQDLAANCADWIPAEKQTVIPNTIDDELVCTTSEIAEKQEKTVDRETRRLLYSGTMTRTKGYQTVLEATRLLERRGTPVQTHFLGRWQSYADKDAFNNRLDKYGLHDTVTHHGLIDDRNELKQLYLQTDIFVLPSYYPVEAQPLTIIEAINAGSPVITTRHSGIPSIVRENREATFVPPKSPDAIAAAVEDLQKADRWLDLSRAARDRFLEQFQPAVVKSKWLALLGDVRK